LSTAVAAGDDEPPAWDSIARISKDQQQGLTARIEPLLKSFVHRSQVRVSGIGLSHRAGGAGGFALILNH
jgi:hypothetical protein